MDKFDTPPIITVIAILFVSYLVLCAEEVLTPTTDYGLSLAEVFYSNPKQRSKQFVPIAPYFCNTAITYNRGFIRLYNTENSKKQEERIPIPDRYFSIVKAPGSILPVVFFSCFW